MSKWLKIKFVVFVFVSMIAIVLSTCSSDVYNPDVCFQENVLPIFISNCTMSGCHNSTSHAAGYDFSTYEGIMQGITPKHPMNSEIYKAVSGANPSMPANNYPKLSRKDVSYIKIWIKMGAKNSSNCSGCDTSNYTYNNRIKPFFTTWCVGCHSSTNASGGYDFSSYSGVKVAITNDRLLGALKHLTGYSAMPQNANQVSDCDINAIQKWIDAGYLNN